MQREYIELLMGHGIGLDKSYLKPEMELLDNYLKAVADLTINDTVYSSILEKQNEELRAELNKKKLEKKSETKSLSEQNNN